MRDAGPVDGAAAVGQVPVVGLDQRLARSRAAGASRAAAPPWRCRRTSRGARSCSATRRAARGARARAPRSASSAGFAGTGVTRLREPAWAISASRSSRTVPNSPAPTLIVSPATSASAARTTASTRSSTAEQLVAVAAVAEHVDAAALADPVEQDLEDAEPLGPDERLGPNDHDLQAPAAELLRDLLGLDLRLAVVADADERVVLVDRVLLRNAVHGRRRDQDRAAHAGVERRREKRSPSRRR